jgi:hypothetical protein
VARNVKANCSMRFTTDYAFTYLHIQENILVYVNCRDPDLDMYFMVHARENRAGHGTQYIVVSWLSVLCKLCHVGISL